jgi:hypothetical protein
MNKCHYSRLYSWPRTSITEQTSLQNKTPSSWEKKSLNSSWHPPEKHYLIFWCRRFQRFNLEPKISACFFNRFKSQMISFRSPWVNRCGLLEEQAPANVGSQHILLLAWPISSSLHSLTLSVMFVGGFGTGNSALWGIGLIADVKLGYSTVCLDFHCYTSDTGQEEVAIWNVVCGLSPNHRNGERHLFWIFSQAVRRLAHVTKQKWGAQLLSWSHTL